MQEWVSEAYWDKAKTYFSFAFSQENDSALFPLHATFALEFLGKAALSKIHPVLVADPRGEGRDILYAFGVDHKSPMTIQAKTVFNRLNHLVDDFSSEDEDICLLLADLRNKEVHSGVSAYDDFPNGRWLPDLFRVVVTLARFVGRDLDELLGDELAAEAIASSEKLEKDAISRVKKRMAEAAKGVAGLREKEIGERRRESEEAWQKVGMAGRLMATKRCPVCKSRARLGMVHIKDKPATITEDGEILTTGIYSPRSFECKVCGLELEGITELKIADLADQQEFSSSQTPSEYFLIEHDYNSEFEYDGPEYDNE